MRYYIINLICTMVRLHGINALLSSQHHWGILIMGIQIPIHGLVTTALNSKIQLLTVAHVEKSSSPLDVAALVSKSMVLLVFC